MVPGVMVVMMTVCVFIILEVTPFKYCYRNNVRVKYHKKKSTLKMLVARKILNF